MKMAEYFQPQKSTCTESSHTDSNQEYIRLGGAVLATNIDYFIPRIYQLLGDHTHLRSSNLLLELLLNSKFRVKGNEMDTDDSDIMQYVWDLKQLKTVNLKQLISL